MKTTGAIIELRFSETPYFSFTESRGSADFTHQFMNFEQFAEKPSKAFEEFGRNESNDWPFARAKLGLPLPMLKSGLVIYDSPGLNDNKALTSTLVKNMRTCDAFIHVLNRGITRASTQILERLMKLGHKPASCLFVITHMEDDSKKQRRATIARLRSDLEKIDPDFQTSVIVIVDARTAFDAQSNHNLLTREYAEFLCHIGPFFSGIISGKYGSFNERLGMIIAEV